ncbi:MAG: hypothetical protein ACYSSI_02625 [Planctomycetota bacterium]|jgi:hypothetical protein
MRVFKPTYTKSIPENAKILTPKKGNFKDKKVARFTDNKGKTILFDGWK